MIGVHVKKGKFATYDSAIIAAALQFRTKAVQIFATNPQCLAQISMNISNLALLSEDHAMRIYIHTSFACRPWASGDLRRRALQSLTYDTGVCESIGGAGVIVHLPASVGKLDEAIARFPTNAIIGLEMVTTLAEDNYSSPSVLRPLAYKICVDTAHLWSMGVNVRHRGTMQSWLSDMADRIMLFHLNGSYELLGSGKDKHAVPFSKNDRIWGRVKKYEDSSCSTIVEYARERNIDMIVENNNDADECVLAFITMAGQ